MAKSGEREKDYSERRMNDSTTGCDILWPITHPCVFGTCIENARCECWDGFSSRGEFMWISREGGAPACTAHEDTSKALYSILGSVALGNFLLYFGVFVVKFYRSKSKRKGLKAFIRILPTLIALWALLHASWRRIKFSSGFGQELQVSIFFFMGGVSIYSSAAIFLYKYERYKALQVRGKTRKADFSLRVLVCFCLFSVLTYLPLILAAATPSHETILLRLMCLLSSMLSAWFFVLIVNAFRPVLQDLRNFIEDSHTLGRSVLDAKRSLRQHHRLRRFLLFIVANMIVFDFLAFCLPLFFHFYRYFVPLRIAMALLGVGLTILTFLVRAKNQKKPRGSHRRTSSKIASFKALASPSSILSSSRRGSSRPSVAPA